MTAAQITQRHELDDAAGRLTIGSRARIWLPDFAGPGAISYTIKNIDAEHATITMHIPNVPCGSTGPTVPEWQVVAA